MKNVFTSLPLSCCVSHKASSLIGLLLLCILSTTSGVAASVPEQISFQNILENKDIAMGEGGALFQDSAGFMWLGGSNALIRYDGYEFRQIYVSANSDKPNEKESVKFVQHIFEDSNHKIWVATRTGVLQFDSNKEKLIRINNDDSQEVKISTSDFLRFVELPSGEILACSISGLFVIDPKSLKYTLILADKAKPCKGRVVG